MSERAHSTPRVEDIPNLPEDVTQEDIDAQLDKQPDTVLDPKRAKRMADAGKVEYEQAYKELAAAKDLVDETGDPDEPVHVDKVIGAVDNNGKVKSADNFGHSDGLPLVYNKARAVAETYAEVYPNGREGDEGYSKNKLGVIAAHGDGLNKIRKEKYDKNYPAGAIDGDPSNPENRVDVMVTARELLEHARSLRQRADERAKMASAKYDKLIEMLEEIDDQNW
jgi:hypothetical protein